tara:strand:- start:13 stop:663 length:651 start_codon:yes stop_codon:yes gene_type:complete
MATVRFSDELRNNIMDNAKRIFSSRIGELEADIPKHWAMTVYDLMYGDNKAKILALPKGYMKMANSFSLAGFKGGDWVESMNESVELLYTPEVPIACTISEADLGVKDGGYYSKYLDADDPRWDEFKGEYYTFCTNIMAEVARRDVFMKGVQKIINTYSTLGPALKAWPPLWELVPEEKQQKHKEVVERKSKGAPVIEGVDLASMTGIAVASKLTR